MSLKFVQVHRFRFRFSVSFHKQTPSFRSQTGARIGSPCTGRIYNTRATRALTTLGPSLPSDTKPAFEEQQFVSTCQVSSATAAATRRFERLSRVKCCAAHRLWQLSSCRWLDASKQSFSQDVSVKKSVNTCQNVATTKLLKQETSESTDMMPGQSPREAGSEVGSEPGKDESRKKRS